MRRDNTQSRWQQVHSKKNSHWGILTLDDLPKTNEKHSLLIAQFQARCKAARKLGKK
jgi:hypothetical protein